MFQKFPSLSQSAATITLFIGLSTVMLPTSVYADDHGGSFSFSDALQQSLDSFAAARDELRSDIRAAIDGLSPEEASEVRDSYAEQVQAMRANGRALRGEARAELEAAGITPTGRAGRGGRGGDAQAADGGNGGRGGSGGGGGRGGRN